MYKYQNDFIPNKDFILKNYSQEDIFSIVFGDLVFKDKVICSPFRKDNQAGCWFEYYKDKLRFVDFGDVKHHRDCFNAIQDTYNVNLQKACELIYNFFEFGIIPDKGVNFISERKNRIFKNITKKNNFDILYKKRVFNTQDKLFWQPYGIKRQQLVEDNIFPIIWYKTKGFNPTDFVIRPLDIAYAITGFISNNIKIYVPLSSNKKMKWFTNCNQNDIGNLSKLPVVGKNLIITKSYKDCRVIRNQNYDSIWFQNEVSLPTEKILYDLSLRFSNIYIFFDNDNTGKAFTEKTTQVFKNIGKEIKSIEIEKQNIKDPSQLVKDLGEQVLQKMLLNFIKF